MSYQNSSLIEKYAFYLEQLKAKESQKRGRDTQVYITKHKLSVTFGQNTVRLKVQPQGAKNVRHNKKALIHTLERNISTLTRKISIIREILRKGAKNPNSFTYTGPDSLVEDLTNELRKVFNSSYTTIETNNYIENGQLYINEKFEKKHIVARREANRRYKQSSRK